MRRLGIAVVGLALTAAALGQGVEQVSYSTRQQQTPAATTLHVTTNLVVVDVVVRGKNGHAVRGLKQGDFALLENKAAQRIASFEEHTNEEAARVEAPPKLSAGMYSNFRPVAAGGPVNVLLFDRFNTQMMNQAELRLRMLKFIDEAKPGTRMAILELVDRVHLLQGVTEDREVLRAALRDRNNPLEAPFETNENKPGIVTADESTRQATTTRAGSTYCELTRQRSLMMQDAMLFLSSYLGNVPGRKNLMWFSGSYPFHMLGGSDGPCMVEAGDFREAASKLADHEVAVYPIGVFAGVKAPTRPTEDMDEFAAVTGGRAFYNANAVDEVTIEAIEDGSNYYTLSYAPSNAKWDNHFRKIEVKLTNGGTAELSYRNGYYAADPNQLVKTTIFGAAAAANDNPRPSAMQLAMMEGVPEAAQIVFTARMLPGAGMENALAVGNEGSKGLKGPYQRYTARFAVDARSLQMVAGNDGLRHGAAEIVVFVYDQRGTVVNAVGRTARMDVKPEVYEGLLHDGLALEMDISVPAKGEYTLRLGVHDLGDDHVGSVEIPVASVRELAVK